MDRWQNWFKATIGDDNAHQVAERLHVSRATVLRWKRGTPAPCTEAIRIAVEYGADPIAAQIAAGYLTTEMVMGGGLRNAVRHAPTGYLIEELHERYSRGRPDGRFPDLKGLID